MFSCCWKKRESRRNNKSSTRSHQRLCAQESGTISIPVQRLTGSPVVRDFRINNNIGGVKGSLKNVNDIESCYGDGSKELSQRREILREGSKRNVHRASPLYRNSTPAERRHIDSPLYRNSTPTERRHTDSPSHNSTNDSRTCSRLSSRWLEAGTRRSALQTAIEKFSQQTEENSSSKSVCALRDGFTLSSSFEGLNKTLLESGVQDSKVSSYDNLYADDEQPNAASLDRKQSLYDNVDDGEMRPLVAATKQSVTQESRDQPMSPVSAKRRRTSRTLPLRFTMFSGVQRSVPASEDSDYVNLPMTSSPSPTAEASREKMNGELGKTGPVAPERKKKLRRGSKTLKLFCPRRPSLLNKIEKQVLAYVPIYGEPSSGSAGGGASPLDNFEFPSPPQSDPFQSSPTPRLQESPRLDTVTEPAFSANPFITYANPTYCPNTSTPGVCVDTDDPFNKPNAYFSF